MQRESAGTAGCCTGDSGAMTLGVTRSVGALIASVLLPALSYVGYVQRDTLSLTVPDAFVPGVAPAILRLQGYLRLRTDHGAPDYWGSTDFLNKSAAVLLPDADVAVHEFVQGKPVVVVTVAGSEPGLESVVLNSHTDVVPAESDKWRWDPWRASLVLAGGEWRIYGRGSQDMKSIGLQYLEALGALTSRGWVPRRNLHLTYVPDEEIGGRDGMGKLVESDVFAGWNVGVALDEGLPNADPRFNLYLGERQTWWLTVNVVGSPGHGATFPENTAAQILHGITNRALGFRDRQFKAMNSSGADIGDVVGINLVYLKSGEVDAAQPAGHVMNMVPSAASAGFDIRVPPTVSAADLEAEIASWLRCEDGEVCPGTTHDYVIKVNNPVITSSDPKINAFMAALTSGFEDAGISESINPGIFFAATDARYLRQKNIPSFGFSPIKDTPNLLHKHDEYITVNGYLRGCTIYESIIKQLGDAAPRGEAFPDPALEDNEMEHPASEPREEL